LLPFSLSTGQGYLRVLRERLATHGFVQGKNLEFDFREVSNSRARAKQSALELIKSNVDAIFSISTIATLGAQDASQSVPIVFSWVGDPVFSGIVKEYRRPGGNTTGVSNRFFELFVKRVELVRHLVPSAANVVMLAGVFDSTLNAAMTRAEPAASQLGLKLVRQEAGSARGFLWKEALADAAMTGADAIVVATPFDQFGLMKPAAEVVQKAKELRMPVIYSDLPTVELGGLISYSYDASEEIRRGADHLARVLKGASPATLAIDQASRFELAINIRTANETNFKIPRPLLVRADRVFG
jgi:putative ABC transport system substrate-binding protein